MPSLTIKNVPKELYEQLKRSAEEHRRSLNSEAIIRLEHALKHVRPDEEALLERIRNLRSNFPAHLSEKKRRKAVDEGRS